MYIVSTYHPISHLYQVALTREIETATDRAASAEARVRTLEAQYIRNVNNINNNNNNSNTTSKHTGSNMSDKIQSVGELQAHISELQISIKHAENELLAVNRERSLWEHARSELERRATAAEHR